MCVSPIRVRVGSGDVHYVRCGRCYECHNQTAFNRAALIRQECALHKYQEFLFLSYSNEFMPRYSYSSFCTYPSGNCQCFPVTPRLLDNKTHQRFSEESDNTLRIDKNTYDKCVSQFRSAREAKSGQYMNHGNTFCVLNPRDLQLFFKRLRKYLESSYVRSVYGISKNSYNKLSKNEKISHPVPKIRFYAIGEYSPRNLRPHYHALVFHDNEYYRSIMHDAVCACWPYGITNNKHSHGEGSSKYISQYITNNSSLPEILRCVAPSFSLHSSKLGGEYDFKFDENLFNQVKRLFDEETVFVFGEKLPSASAMLLARRLFPKISGYGRLDLSRFAELCVQVHGLFRDFRKTNEIAPDASVSFRMAKFYSAYTDDFGFNGFLPRDLRDWMRVWTEKKSSDPVTYLYRVFRQFEHIEQICRHYRYGLMDYLSDYDKFESFLTLRQYSQYYAKLTDYHNDFVRIIQSRLHVELPVAISLSCAASQSFSSELFANPRQPWYILECKRYLQTFDCYHDFSDHELVDLVIQSYSLHVDFRETFARDLYLSMVKHRVENEALDRLNY